MSHTQAVRPRFGRIPTATQYAGIGRSKLYELAAEFEGLFRKSGNAVLVDFDKLELDPRRSAGSGNQATATAHDGHRDQHHRLVHAPDASLRRGFSCFGPGETVHTRCRCWKHQSPRAGSKLRRVHQFQTPESSSRSGQGNKRTTTVTVTYTADTPAPASTASPGFYVPKSTKRPRRLKTQVKAIKDAIKAILDGDHPQTVRQVFYALTVRGLIAKVEGEYHQTVIRLLGDMREAGEIPFSHIADHTRWMRKPSSFTGVEDCLNSTAEFYRRNLWNSMPVQVEIWCEKDALAGVLMEETETYDIPLMVARGYSSMSFLHSSAKAIEAKKKPAFIYHFGDLDPSGVDAARDIEAKLRRYAPGVEIHFERPAVTRQQADEWNLPSRPTKQTDTRAKKWTGTSVELDAIPAARLREIVRECINRHVDQQQLDLLRAAEESERELLTKWARTYGGAR